VSKSSAKKKKHPKRSGHRGSDKISNQKKQISTGVTSPSKPFSKTTIIILSLVGMGILAAVVIFTFLYKGSGELSILYPMDGTLFPPEITAPTFRWTEKDARVNKWSIRFKFDDNNDPINIEVGKLEWKPERALWENIKKRSLENKTTVTVESIKTIAGFNRSLSNQTISISTSKDSVGAPIFYRDVPLPFFHALNNLETIRWRLGDIASDNPSKVILENLPVCGNCHSFSRNGQTIGMDVDYANDKGSYVIAKIEKEIVLSEDKIITWSDYERDDGHLTFGLLSQVSPNGRYAVSTVKDRSIFVPKDDIEYSQLFFPIKGILVVYDTVTDKYWALPGADNPEYVQSNPMWSHDGSYLIFARSRVYRNKKIEQSQNAVLSTEMAAEFIEGRRDFKFNLFRIPFNNGRGGTPEPISGASNNGMSNYFPRISPDGKWIVFCKANNFMLLQPDSRLYIMPSEGGNVREMNCNTSNMNSWHSWSPNGKWLTFSSKMNGPYTQLYLTHIDENGNDTSPVLLEHLTIAKRAVNIPEFVNIHPEEWASMSDGFSNTSTYFLRIALNEITLGNKAKAINTFNKALQISPPDNPESYTQYGHIKSALGEYKEAIEYYDNALQLDNQLVEAYSVRGFAQCKLGLYQEAIKSLDTAIELNPKYSMAYQNRAMANYHLGNYEKANDDVQILQSLGGTLDEVFYDEYVVEIYLNLGKTYMSQKEFHKAREQFNAVTELNPENIDAHHNLGNLFKQEQDTEAARKEFETIINIDPKNISAHIELGQLYADMKDYQSAAEKFKTVLELAPDNRFSRIYLGRSYTEMEDFTNAERTFRSILINNPNDVAAHMNLGIMYTKAKRFDNAISELRTVLTLNSKDAESRACFMLGTLLFDQKGATQEAISVYKRGLSLDPGNFNGHIYLGNLYQKTGNLGNAIIEFELALKLNPAAPNLKEKINDLKRRYRK